MPQDTDMVAVAGLCHGAPDAGEAEAWLAALCGDTGLRHGVCHGAAGYRRIAMPAPA